MAEPPAPADRDEPAPAEPGEPGPDGQEPGGPEPAAEPDDAVVAAPYRSESLLPVGNPLRYRALLPIGLGALVGVGAMASAASPRAVTPIGLAATLVVTVGLLDLLGSFDDETAEATAEIGVRALVPSVVLTLAGLCAQLLLLRAAVAGTIGVATMAVAMPAAFLTTVVGLFRAGVALGPGRRDEQGRPRPLLHRHGFWLVVVVTVLYLPMLGSHSLSDPWETHYGEVAREILARNDWISLWWAQEKWFWSKPVLGFWLQAAAMALTGVRYEPGEMLAAARGGLDPRPEWAVRMPVFLLVVVGVYLLYKGVAATHGRRAGLLGALVLVTMPQFFLVAQQTMTDMPFVAAMAGALGAFLWAARQDGARVVAPCPVRLGRLRVTLSFYHLVVGLVCLLVVVQVLYLLSRNLHVTLSLRFDLRLHADRFAAGSPGNCTLPGNDPCRVGLPPAVGRFEPAGQALIWIQALALVLWLSWGERRLKRLGYLLAWVLVALATMAKGVAGLGLPVLAVLCWVAASRRWRELGHLEIPAGLLTFACLVMPWLVAMYVRHGQPFTDRLLFHDMFKRAFDHVHDTNTGVDTSFRYYLWQLGYACFPWSALAAVALGRGLASRNDTAASHAAVCLGAWFLACFALFSLMGTKYHHYILPALPPLGMLTGTLLDRMMRPSPPRDDDRSDEDASERVLFGAVAVGAALATLLVGRDLAVALPGRQAAIRLMHLFTYNYSRPWPDSIDLSPALGCFTLGTAGLTAALAIDRLRRPLVVMLLAVAGAWTAWGIDVYLTKLSPHWGQRELFLAYEKLRVARPGPMVAYQMNWKGENFYQGNHVAAFVSSGREFQSWIDGQKRLGHKTFYFVTEHSRTGALRHELGTPERFTELSDEQLNNKFLLLRAEFP